MPFPGLVKAVAAVEPMGPSFADIPNIGSLTWGRPAVGQLKAAGSQAELLHLPGHGVFGYGHGLIYEKNSDDALAPVLNWLIENTETPG